MKLILKDVKIYGYDKNIKDAYGKFGTALYITDEDKSKIDQYLYNKVSTNQDGDFIFYGKSKQPIPIFTADKQPILEPVNEVFIAEVSILIDEFEGKDGENIRYSKALGIKYIKKVENEEVKVFVPKKEYNEFDDIFADEEELTIPAPVAPVVTSNGTAPLEPDTMNVNDGNSENDLPF